MHVRDIMVPVAGAVTADMKVRDAAERMKGLNIDPMPVTEGDRVVGLLGSETLQKTAATDLLATGSKLVADVMTREVVCCTDDQPVSDAVEHIDRTLGEDASGRIPVTDGQGHLVGIVSIEDLRTRDRNEEAGVHGSQAVHTTDERLGFDEDRTDYMSDASFPASDPPSPPSAMGRERTGES